MADAQHAQQVLDGCGIKSHIADEAHAVAAEVRPTHAIRVMVDNRVLDRARRALDAWKRDQRVHAE
jgi:hypothetical protein